MNIRDLTKLYEEERKRYGEDVYKHISELLRKSKKLHYDDWLKSPTPNHDHEQSWRAFKGKNFEKLLLYIIKTEVENLGLRIINGGALERSSGKNLPDEMNRVKRNLLIDYGEFGCHLPDVDLIVFNPRNCRILAVVSSKITLRERIAQTGYWKIKLSADNITKHIKVYFITPDEDGTLSLRKPTKKGRAIVEVDTDGAYVMTEETVQQSDKVKTFDQFIPDIKKMLKDSSPETSADRSQKRLV